MFTSGISDLTAPEIPCATYANFLILTSLYPRSMPETSLTILARFSFLIIPVTFAMAPTIGAAMPLPIPVRINAAFRTGEVDGPDPGDAVGVHRGDRAEQIGVGDELQEFVDRDGWN